MALLFLLRQFDSSHTRSLACRKGAAASPLRLPELISPFLAAIPSMEVLAYNKCLQKLRELDQKMNGAP